jgi:hypothetical protein
LDPLHPEANPEDSGTHLSQSSEPCRTVEALSPAFALGALDPQEQEQFLAALQACPEQAGAIQEYSALARLLGPALTLPHLQPPQALADRLAAAIRADTDTAAVAPRATMPDFISPVKPAGRRFLWPVGQRAFVPAAYLAIAAILLLFNLYWIAQVVQLRARQAELAETVERQAEDLERQSADLERQAVELSRQSEVLARQSDALALLASPDIKEIVLPASQEASNARAEVYWNPGWNVAVLYAHEFPQVDDDMGFQLWLRQGDNRLSAGVFQVDDTGSGTLVFDVPQALDTLDALGITTEPIEGSPGPTGDGVVRFVRQSQ